MFELEPYSGGSLLPSRQTRAVRAVITEARIAALKVRCSELVTKDMMDSVVRVDQYRTQLPADSDALNAMLLDLEIGHQQTCSWIQNRLYKWDS
jgi:hypothetical protein